MTEIPDIVHELAEDEPTIIEVRRGPVPDYVEPKRYARPDDVSRTIDRSGMVVDADTGELYGVYIRTGGAWPDLAGVCKNVRTGKRRPRQSGITGETMVFGYMPRKKGRHDWCRATQIAARQPTEEARLEEIGSELGEVYDACNPEMYAQHLEAAEDVLPEYVMGDGPFTSGIINYDFSIPYHYDAGNFPDMWNAMVVIRRDATGGHTVFPELDAVFEMPDGAAMLSNAQGLIHGVTPIRKNNANGYRFSAVWYSLKDLWRCKTQAEELKSFRKRRTEQEYKRLQNTPST